MEVIADTSFLMIPGMFGVDIFSELERLLERRCALLIPSPVLQELKQISERGKPRERAAARVGLQLARRGSVVEIGGGADEAIIELAVQKRCAVGTTDKALIKELRRKGIPVIYLSHKSHLAKEGYLG